MTRRYAQSDPSGSAETLYDGLDQVNDSLEQDLSAPAIGERGLPEDPQSISDVNTNFNPDQMQAAQSIASSMMAQRLLAEISQSPYGEQIKNVLMSNNADWQRLQTQINNTGVMQDLAENKQVQGLANELQKTVDFKGLEDRIRRETVRAEGYFEQLEKLNNERSLTNQKSIAAFNLSEFRKKSQVSPINDGSSQESFFIAKYIKPLLSFRGDKGQNDIVSEQAKTEILGMISPAAEEEVNQALEQIQSLHPEVGFSEAEEILRYIYNNWVPESIAIDNQSAPNQQSMPVQGMEPVMSESKVKGIIKHNLSLNVLSNSQELQKTASKHFGNPYMLYGPTEKRICPKLSGRGGDAVVSEYICRHHCLDGIVIDDNKTVCGEALWRAHVMDKFSREYVDKDGKITGGYIEKRFDVEHNVPEENRMRLLPGETRKPRPPEWGSTESRMQAMRAKEGEKRGYRPETNTSDPFNWAKDVDQNNVNSSQSERDRRETASGHKLVEYTNKDKQENNPKTAFNLKNFKIAQYDLASPNSGYPATGTSQPVAKNCQTCGAPVQKQFSWQVTNECGGCAKKRIDKNQAKPMTGPRGPIGPDNPQSDDSGLSHDMMDSADDNFGDDRQENPIVEEILSQMEGQSPEQMVQFLNSLDKHDKSRLSTQDWDDLLNGANDIISRGGGQNYLDIDRDTLSVFIGNLDQPSSLPVQPGNITNMASTSFGSFNLSKFKKAGQGCTDCSRKKNAEPKKDSIAKPVEKFIGVKKKSFNLAHFKKIAKDELEKSSHNVPVPDDGKPIEPVDEKYRDTGLKKKDA